MSNTPETDAAWKDCTPSDHKGLAILATMRKIERERDELSAEITRLTDDRNCEKRMRQDAEETRENLAAEVSTAREQTAAVVRVMDGVVVERDELLAENERWKEYSETLKADKVRLFAFLGKYISIEAVDYDEGAMRDILGWVVRGEELELVLCENSVADDLSQTIDAAMK